MCYCESTFIRWHPFSWFQQNASINGVLNLWFQTIKAINTLWESFISLDFSFHGLSEPLNPRKLEPYDD